MGNKTTAQTILPAASAEEKRLMQIAAQLGGEQLSAVQGYSPYREQLFSMIPALGRSISRDLNLNIDPSVFRQITPEERAYQEFLNTAPEGVSIPGTYPETNEEKLTKYSPSAQLLSGTPLEKLGGWGAVTAGKAKKKRAAYAAWAAEEQRRQQQAKIAAWQDKAAQLKSAADASVAKIQHPSQSLGLSDQDMYDYGYSPYEEELVNRTTASQYELGASDINQAYTESLQTLAQELAPARGMRGYDSPILDRGGKLALENQRQLGNLGLGLRAKGTESLLNIAQQAKQNRLSLLGFLGNQGLGLGTGDALGAANMMQQGRNAQAGRSQSTSGLSTQDYASIAAGAGSLIAAFSSRELKDVGVQVSGQNILGKLRTLKFYRWNYKGEKTQHMGPMAEDFRDTFGVGDGKTLALIDVMGVLLAAMQGLAEEVQHG